MSEDLFRENNQSLKNNLTSDDTFCASFYALSKRLFFGTKYFHKLLKNNVFIGDVRTQYQCRGSDEFSNVSRGKNNSREKIICNQKFSKYKIWYVRFFSL